MPMSIPSGVWQRKALTDGQVRRYTQTMNTTKTFHIYQDDTYALTVEADSAVEALARSLEGATWNDHPAGDYVVGAVSADDPADSAEITIEVTQ